MKYIGIVSDISWDNFILINNKFKKIDDENFTLHFIYNKNLQMFSNCAYNNNLTIIRNSGKSICNCAYNLLKACDIWLVFTNNIEYLTLPQLIISKCTEFNIKYIIISEYSRDNDIYSFDKSSSSFKKTINNISTCENKINVESFNYNDYNLSANMSTFVNVDNTTNVKVRFRLNGFKTSSVLGGDTNMTETGFTFIRLGDSQ